VTEKLPGNPIAPGVAGRFYVGNDTGFTPEQYADMALTAMFESAKNYPLPLKVKVLEAKLEMAKILNNYFAEAMVDAARRIGRQYELQEKTKARLMLPAGYAQRLDEGGVWHEAEDASN
jgi:hypothetical protein